VSLLAERFVAMLERLPDEITRNDDSLPNFACSKYFTVVFLQSVVGDAVNLAARLMARAEGGDVLVDGDTERV
jgi:hypothetical protein